MRNLVLGTLLVGGALALTGPLASAGIDALQLVDETEVAPTPSPEPVEPLTTDGEEIAVPGGREVVLTWGSAGVDAVAVTPDRPIRLWDFLVGRDRGVVLAWADGGEFGYLYPVAGTLPSGENDEVKPVDDLDDLGGQLTDHDLFPDVYVRPVGGTVVEGFRETLVLDVTTRAASTRDPRPVLRVAPVDDAEALESVGVGPARGMTERSWIVDVDGRPWALTVDGDDPEAIEAGEELALSLRFETAPAPEPQAVVPQP